MYSQSIFVGVRLRKVLSSVIICCPCVFLHLFNFREDGCLRPAILVINS